MTFSFQVSSFTVVTPGNQSLFVEDRVPAHKELLVSLVRLSKCTGHRTVTSERIPS